MNLYVFIYDGCALFEVILACYFLKNKYNINMISINKDLVQVFEGMTIKCDEFINKVEINENDVVIIPGGNIEILKDEELLKEFLELCISKNCKIGAICAGVNLLIENNIISTEDKEKYSINNIKNGDRYVLAKANEYVDFSLSLGIICDIYKDVDDFEETIRFFKQFKEC